MYTTYKQLRAIIAGSQTWFATCSDSKKHSEVSAHTISRCVDKLTPAPAF